MNLAEFHTFLARYPSLALEHEVGQAIRDQLQRSPVVALDPKSWYHGVEQEHKPIFRDFLPLDPTQVAVPEQRFNNQGERAFYLSDSSRGAARECANEEAENVWVLRIGVARIEKILDLTGSPTLLTQAATYCGQPEPVCRPPHLKPEYRVPRFVADCARHAGLHGLLVPSTKEGTNLVLFVWRDEDLTPEGEPQQVCL